MGKWIIVWVVLLASVGCGGGRVAQPVPTPEATETREHRFPSSPGNPASVAGVTEVPVWVKQGPDADILATPKGARIDFALSLVTRADERSAVMDNLNELATSATAQRIQAGSLRGFRQLTTDEGGLAMLYFYLVRDDWVITVLTRSSNEPSMLEEAETVVQTILYSIRPEDRAEPLAQ
jgi:hypothetical protein